MDPTVDVKYDARTSELRFAPLGNGRFLLCAPGDVSVSLYITEAQAVRLYELLRLYLRNPLARWGPPSIAAQTAAK